MYMKGKSLGAVIFLFLLCFMLSSPFASAEEMPEDGEVPEGWIRIIYLAGDNTKEVMIPAGCAIANLWEPETLYGSKFLYWTLERTDPLNEKYKVTNETVFYEITFLYPVTEDTPDELEEIKESLEDWEAGGTEQTTEQETERDWAYYIVRVHKCNGSGDILTFQVVKDMNKEDRIDFVNEITDRTEVKKGCKFAGWYTEENGGGKKFTGEKKIKSDMDVYGQSNDYL